MWLDADDVLPQTSLKKLENLKANFDKSTDMYFLKYNTLFDDKGKCLFSYYRERIMKRTNNYIWQGKVHEAIVPSGKIEYLDISIEHIKVKEIKSDRNLNIYRKMLENNEIFGPREQFY